MDEYDPAAARALLDKFGYKDRDGDGYRETPDGKPLTLVLASTTDAAARASDELWKRNMDAIGIRITFVKQTVAGVEPHGRGQPTDDVGAGQRRRRSPMRTPSTRCCTAATSARATMRGFTLAEFDRLYEQSRSSADDRARTALFHRMNDLVHAYAPWILGEHRYGNVLTQPWFKGYKPDPLLRYQWKFYDVAPH